MEKTNILDEIRQVKDDLPRQQRQLCEFILSRPIEASTLTINEMSKAAGVGITTIIRMVQALGMEKYNQLKVRLRREVLEQRATSMVYWNTSQDGAQANLLSAVDTCSAALSTMKQPDFLYSITTGATLIYKAKRIYVLGLRMSTGTSTLFELTLRNYGFDTCLLSREADYVIDRICEMGEEDVLVSFANSPVAKTTADAIKLCRHLGRKQLVITGRLTSDLADLADVVINTGYPNRPATIPATMLAAELLMLELSRMLEEDGRQEQKQHIQKVETLSAENEITLWG